MEQKLAPESMIIFKQDWFRYLIPCNRKLKWTTTETGALLNKRFIE